MPIFRYVALNRKGKEEKGIIDAPGAATARKNLRLKGLYVRTLTQDREKKERELFPFLTKLLYRVPRKEVGLFVRQLGTLLDAGLPLDRSLASISETVENEYLKKAIIEIRAGIVEGETLSDAMKKHPAIFPPVYHHLVAVGEKTGAYEQALLRLADLEDANQELQNKVLTAAFYPLIMLFLLGGIMLFMLGVVFPKIQALFAQVKAELPFITKLVIGMSNFVASGKILILVAVIVVLYLLFHRWKSSPEGRVIWEGFLMKVPMIGSISKKVLLARFTRNLGVMLENRVPLIAALQVVSKVVNHGIFSTEISLAIDKIKEGTKISDAFRQSAIVNQMTLGMLSAGELSDTVPQMVTKIADVLDNELDSSIQRLSLLLEPIMIVVMGGVIVLIMVAILLPMYNLTKQLQM